MKNICFYFQVHQPFRLRTYRFFDIGHDHYYYDDFLNRSIMQKIARNCYLPANRTILETIQKHQGRFKVAYSISGSALEQFELYAPEVIDSFRALAQTGCVEFLAETYGHTLGSLKNQDEFERQVRLHSQKIEELFGYKPTVFRNTELVYSDHIGEKVYEMGYKAMLTEGARHVLGWKSPNYLYCNALNPRLKVLLRNYKLSDDVAFRFSNSSWSEWPLTADKFAGWLSDTPHDSDVLNLFMDYETFGEHQWEGTGIFDFLRHLPTHVLSREGVSFATPSEIADKLQPIATLNVPYPISWADEERDLTAWLGNHLQKEAFDNLYKLADKMALVTDKVLLRDWQRLQTSDHFYYMCTKFFADGEVHMYFNPYNSPYEAFMNFMNVLGDFSERVELAQKRLQGSVSIDQEIAEMEARLAQLKLQKGDSEPEEAPKKTAKKTAKPAEEPSLEAIQPDAPKPKASRAKKTKEE